MKRRSLGTLRTHDGHEVEVRNKTVHATLSRQMAEIDRLTEALEVANSIAQSATLDRDGFREQLMRLQNHWWVRLGEALRIVRAVPLPLAATGRSSGRTGLASSRGEIGAPGAT